MTNFESLNDMGLRLADMFNPPERISVSEAAEKNISLNIPGAYVGPYRVSTTPYMQEPMDTLASREYEGVAFCGPAQSGKALPLDVPIATPAGWTTMGQIKVGDVIFGSDGRPTKVTFATKVMRGHTCYRITFDDGTSMPADAGHKWQVDDLLSENRKVLTTTEIIVGIMQGRPGRSRYAISNTAPLQAHAADLPLDPYSFGVWLGDGSSNHSTLHLNASDRDIAERVRSAGFGLSVEKVKDAHTLTIKPEVSFRHALKATGVLHTKRGPGTEKRIPAAYLRASEAQRRALLAGLMDTDGYASKNGVCEIISTIPRLADGIEELLVSLGMKVRRILKPTRCSYKGEFVHGFAERITFAPEVSPFWTARKVQMFNDRAKPRRESYTGRRFITKIDPIASVPVRCIQVASKDHLFLAGRQMVPTHNTEALILNWLAYGVAVDPMDMIIYNPSHSAARDFAVRRVDRMHRHSPAIGRMLSPKADDDNRHDKMYRNGMLLTLSWPSVTEFAGKPIGRAALTDFDRMDDDIDGDGNPFDLASKRTTTFGSFAMTMAESSPSRPLEDPRWIQETPHQAPPVTGILALYNRGDRRRWYWPCLNCDHYFEGSFRSMRWADGADTSGDKTEASESCYMPCPNCDFRLRPNMRRDMNEAGAWLKDGQTIDPVTHKIVGKGTRSRLASFWLKGVAATFISWEKMVYNFLTAEEDYRRTLSEDALKKFWNTDEAEPYVPKNVETIRTPQSLKDRAEDYGQDGTPEVPSNVRFLTAAIDVQKNMFVVQVYGIAPGNPFDIYIVDRFSVVKSNRKDAAGDTQWVKPGSYVEDWNLLGDVVLTKSYPIAGTDGLRMEIKMTVCDSGGREGVTTNAYAYYRALRRSVMHDRFHLVKGEPSPLAPRTRVGYPDSSTRSSGARAGAQGDVPVLFIASNLGKDALDNRLNITEPGKGMIHFAKWMDDEIFNEMCGEIRTPKGWEKAKGGRSKNEAWDLTYYTIGLLVSPVLNVERLDWQGKVPAWADVHDRNPLVSGRPKVEVAEIETPRYKVGKFAAALG